MGRAIAGRDQTPGRPGHPAACTTRRHFVHASRDTAAPRFSGPSASWPMGAPLHGQAGYTRILALPEPLALPAPPHTPGRCRDPETAGAAPPAPALAFLPQGRK